MKGSTVRKLVLWGLGVALLIPVLLAVTVVLLPAATLKVLVVFALGTVLQRDVDIAEFDVQLFNPTRIEARQVVVANAGWAGEEPFFVAEGLTVELDTDRLTDGVVALRQLHLLRPRTHLTLGEDGHWNWPVPPADPDQPPPDAGEGPAPPSPEEQGWILLVERAQIEGGLLTLDMPNEPLRRFDPIDVVVTAQGEGLAIDGSVGGATGPATIDGTTSDLTALNSGEAAKIDLRFEAPGAVLTVDGTLGGTPLFDLGVDGAVDEPELLARWAGDEVVLDEQVPERVALQARLVGDFGALEVQGLNLDADDTAVSGDLRLVLAERPRLSGTLDVGALDLSRFAGGAAEPEEPPVPDDPEGGEGWPEREVPWPVPLPLDLDLGMDFERLRLNGFDFASGRANVYADSLVTRLTIEEARGLGGSLGGEAVVRQGEGKAGRLSLRLDGDALGAASFLQAVGLEPLLSGQSAVTLDLATAGSTVADLIGSLEGRGRLGLRDAAFSDGDTDLAIRRALALLTGSAGGGNQAKVDAELPFEANDGVLNLGGLSLDLAPLRLRGEGRMDLAERSLSLELRPEALAPSEGAGGGGEALSGLLPAELAELLARRGGLQGMGLLDEAALLVEGSWRSPVFKLALGEQPPVRFDDTQALAALVLRAAAEAGLLGAVEEQADDLARDVQERVGREIEERLGEGAGGEAKEAVGRLLDGIFGNNR